MDGNVRARTWNAFAVGTTPTAGVRNVRPTCDRPRKVLPIVKRANDECSANPGDNGNVIAFRRPADRPGWICCEDVGGCWIRWSVVARARIRRWLRAVEGEVLRTAVTLREERGVAR
jgi:hypothetical protein